jgi:predicted permease
VNFERFKREFKTLSLAKKIIFLASIAAFVLAFLPWFETSEIRTSFSAIGDSDQALDPIVESGFSKFQIFGTVSVIFALISFILVIRELFWRQDKFLTYHHSALWMILAGQSLFTIIIAFFVFPASFADNAITKFRYGIYFSFIAHLVIFIAGYLVSLEQGKTSKKSESWKQMTEEEMRRLNLSPEIPKEQLNFS